MNLARVLLIVGVLIFIVLTFPNDATLQLHKVNLEMLAFACVFGSMLAERWPGSPRKPNQ